MMLLLTGAMLAVLLVVFFATTAAAFTHRHPMRKIFLPSTPFVVTRSNNNDNVINVNGVYDDTYGVTSGDGTINAQDALISGTLKPG